MSYLYNSNVSIEDIVNGNVFFSPIDLQPMNFNSRTNSPGYDRYVVSKMEIDDNKDDLDFSLQNVISISAIDNLQSLDDKSSIQNTDNNNDNSLPSTTQTISDSPQPSPTSNDFSILFEIMKEKIGRASCRERV